MQGARTNTGATFTRKRGGFARDWPFGGVPFFSEIERHGRDRPCRPRALPRKGFGLGYRVYLGYEPNKLWLGSGWVWGDVQQIGIDPKVLHEAIYKVALHTMMRGTHY